MRMEGENTKMLLETYLGYYFQIAYRHMHYPTLIYDYDINYLFFNMQNQKKKTKKTKKPTSLGFHCGSVETNPYIVREDVHSILQSLALLSGLEIQCCHELWCWLHLWLGFGVAVAVV